jgi:hypothetical protein
MLRRIESMQTMVNQLVLQLEALHQEVSAREGAGAGAGATAQGHPTSLSKALYGDMPAAAPAPAKSVVEEIPEHCNGPIGQLNQWLTEQKIEGLQESYEQSDSKFICTLSLKCPPVSTNAKERSKKEAKKACAQKMCVELFKKYNDTFNLF